MPESGSPVANHVPGGQRTRRACAFRRRVTATTGCLPRYGPSILTRVLSVDNTNSSILTGVLSVVKFTSSHDITYLLSLAGSALAPARDVRIPPQLAGYIERPYIPLVHDHAACCAMRCS